VHSQQREGGELMEVKRGRPCLGFLPFYVQQVVDGIDSNFTGDTEGTLDELRGMHLMFKVCGVKNWNLFKTSSFDIYASLLLK
jgi:hypothetical protein